MNSSNFVDAEKLEFEKQVKNFQVHSDKMRYLNKNMNHYNKNIRQIFKYLKKTIFNNKMRWSKRFKFYKNDSQTTQIKIGKNFMSWKYTIKSKNIRTNLIKWDIWKIKRDAKRWINNNSLKLDENLEEGKVTNRNLKI